MLVPGSTIREIRLAGCFGHDFHGSFMQIPSIDRTVDLPS
jgi:hypothetical protein